MTYPVVATFTLPDAPAGASPAQVAAAVRAELALELGRLDVAVSTRATPADVQTVIGVPVAPSVEVGP